MQSVPITTTVVSLNPAHEELYSIQHYVKVCILAFCPYWHFVYLALVFSVGNFNMAKHHTFLFQHHPALTTEVPLHLSNLFKKNIISP
jgi:hypothetical protein